MSNRGGAFDPYHNDGGDAHPYDHDAHHEGYEHDNTNNNNHDDGADDGADDDDHYDSRGHYESNEPYDYDGAMQEHPPHGQEYDWADNSPHHPDDYANDSYGGDDYDSRREQEGQDSYYDERSGYDDRSRYEEGSSYYDESRGYDAPNEHGHEGGDPYYERDYHGDTYQDEYDPHDPDGRYHTRDGEYHDRPFSHDEYHEGDDRDVNSFGGIWGDRPDDDEHFDDEPLYPRNSDEMAEMEERDREVRERRRRLCCLWLLILLCCLILLLIIILLIYFLTRGKSHTGGSSPQSAPTVGPTSYCIDDDDCYVPADYLKVDLNVTTKMAPEDFDCNYNNGDGFANVLDQCRCQGKITDVPADVRTVYNDLVNKLGPVFYQNYDYPISACVPSNEALIWLSSGNMRAPGEVRQRYMLALLYYSTNGTKWVYDNEWLTALNECLWLGVQCNNYGFVNNIAFSANNFFGQVSHCQDAKIKVSRPVLFLFVLL